MLGAGFIATGILHPGLVRRFKAPANRRTVLVNSATHGLSDTPVQSHAFGIVFSARAFHASGLRREIFGELERDGFFRFAGISLSPIEFNAKERATGSA